MVGQTKWEQSFLQATEENAGKLDVDDHGAIIDKATGKQPDYNYGIPFPKIDPNDPKAAVKVVWNQFLVYWYGGSSFNRESGHTVLAMITTKRAPVWPSDTPIEDLEEAGLPRPCAVRLKVFTLDNRLIVKLQHAQFRAGSGARAQNDVDKTWLAFTYRY